MMLTKFWKLFPILSLAVLVIVGTGCTGEETKTEEATTTLTESETDSEVVDENEEKLTIKIDTPEVDYEDEIYLQDDMSALDALNVFTNNENLSVETKVYDFGTSVEAIGDYKGGENNMYWMFYVNGEMSPNSADTHMLEVGDIVEYKYEESTL